MTPTHPDRDRWRLVAALLCVYTIGWCASCESGYRNAYSYVPDTTSSAQPTADATVNTADVTTASDTQDSTTTPDGATAPDSATNTANHPQQVLFIGNSYTQTNNLPQLLEGLVAAAGITPFKTGLSAAGGLHLQDHAAPTHGSFQALDDGWELVILQEQSIVPAVPQYRGSEMYPAARTLVAELRKHGAVPLFFQTWGRRDGLSEWGDDLRTFELMQDQLTIGYQGIADELSAGIAPVGEAFRSVRNDFSDIALHIADGSHPSLEGSYLAACVFYAAIFRKSPEGLAYTAGLPVEIVAILQKAAATTVLDQLSRWNLN